MIQVKALPVQSTEAVQRAGQYLELKTQAYWNLSTDANGRGKPITTAQAIDFCRELSRVVGPQRHLSKVVAGLNQGIIQGPSQKKKKNNVRYLPPRLIPT